MEIRRRRRRRRRSSSSGKIVYKRKEKNTLNQNKNKTATANKTLLDFGVGLEKTGGRNRGILLTIQNWRRTIESIAFCVFQDARNGAYR
jgi:hypothetical protein